MGTTFREVSLDQKEAEEISNEKTERGATSPAPRPASDTDKIIPSLSLYEVIKGRPYSVDYLQLNNHWKLGEVSDNADKVFGKMKTKIGVLEGYIRKQIKSQYLPDSIESYQKILAMLDKITGHKTEQDPLKRLNKIYSFIISKNKSKALNNLRRALMVRAVDELINLDEIKPSTIGKFMPRKDN